MTATAAPALSPGIGQVFRRARFWIVVGLVVLLLVVVQLVSTASGRLTATFDPAGSTPAGGKALAQVLRQQGVAVTVVTSLAAAERSSGTLLVDDGDGLLTRDTWRTLSSGRARLVVASPAFAALQQLAPGLRQAGRPDARTVQPGCDLGLARRAGAMSLEGVRSSLRGTGGVLCFTDSSGAGQVATLRTDGTRVVLLADRTAFTNEHIDQAGNAAVALNVLGATDSLTWYVPNALDFGGGDRTLQDLTPPWVTPVSALLLLAGLAAALWRGRRLGPVVIERLPVSVRSRETVEGRARLYERGRAHLRAADSLRIGAIGRMAPLLGLSASASVEEVAVAAARLTGTHRDRLSALLLTDEPQSDRDLMRISDDLARLEAAVRAAAVPGTTKGTP